MPAGGRGRAGAAALRPHRHHGACLQLRTERAAVTLHIALTADPELPVPPRLYGGIERVVDLLARGLEARGHRVTLFAHPDSASAGRLAPWPGRSSRSGADTARNAAALAA